MASVKIISVYVMHELKFLKYKHSYLNVYIRYAAYQKYFVLRKKGVGRKICGGST